MLCVCRVICVDPRKNSLYYEAMVYKANAKTETTIQDKNQFSPWTNKQATISVVPLKCSNYV